MTMFVFPSRSELEEFKRDIENRLDALHAEISRTASESADVASTAAENALAIEAKIKITSASIGEIFSGLEQLKTATEQELEELEAKKTEALTANSKLLAEINATEELYKVIVESKNAIDLAATEVKSKVSDINEYLEESEGLPESVAQTQKLLEESKATSDSIANLLNHVLKRKTEIDDLHKAIYGVDVKDTEGNVEHADGLKDELERSYKGVSDEVPPDLVPRVF